MIKIAVIEDNNRYREFIKLLIEGVNDLEVVFDASNCLDIKLPIIKVEPDVIILDIDLPGKSGIETIEELKQAVPNANILILTVFEDDEKIFKALKEGADGYLLKKDSIPTIIQGIRAVHMGQSAMNGMIAKKVLTYFQKKPSIDKPEDYELTKREHEILELLIEGLSYKEIAEKCFISKETLNSHIKNVYRKLNVHSRSQAAARFRK